MELPQFKYHLDPVATGSIAESDESCVCCERTRGWIYTGPVYAVEEYENCICPWCIADGSAHQRLDATFADDAGVGGGGTWESVADHVVAEVVQRTPGFSGWQPEQWWTHCGDADAFLGRAGKRELLASGASAVEAIRKSTGLDEGPKWQEFLAALHMHGSPTAYLFSCVKCGAIGGYQDCD